MIFHDEKSIDVALRVPVEVEVGAEQHCDIDTELLVEAEVQALHLGGMPLGGVVDGQGPAFIAWQEQKA
jgi:hypothetical protein